MRSRSQPRDLPGPAFGQSPGRWPADMATRSQDRDHRPDVAPLLSGRPPRCIWSETGRTAEDDVRDLRRPFRRARPSVGHQRDPCARTRGVRSSRRICAGCVETVTSERHASTGSGPLSEVLPDGLASCTQSLGVEPPVGGRIPRSVRHRVRQRECGQARLSECRLSGLRARGRSLQDSQVLRVGRP